ncbi:hemolysin family protein [Pseudofulvibacter geojedonensis]|uniref:Hemolysin family protein n=1 Tax=Pseudofulvibacter geojedonensis TaxID=1123758 RepID=A0ABW3I462_9FLAO
MLIELLIIISMLLLSGFFSGMEMAYVSSNKIHIELEKKKEGFLAKVLAKITEKPSKFIATMLVGNNIALVIYGLFMGDLIMNWLLNLQFSSELLQYFVMNFSLLIQTVISTIVILITAEFLPKVFFQIYANSLLKFFALPAYLFYLLFHFVSLFVMWISDFVLKTFFKTDGDQVQLSFSKVELGNYISEQMESVAETDEVDAEIQLFQNALEFAEVKSREVMVPRTEIVAVELHESIKNVKQLFVETGYSKVLVYKDTIDDIIGYVHSFDMFKKPRTVKSILLPVEFVPETMLVSDVLDVLIKRRKSISIVLDEYGGTSGMMTVEDIVEELFGEIEDEHDTIDLVEEKHENDTYTFSARQEVDYVNETYKLDLPKAEQYETLGGLIVFYTEEIPSQDEEVYVGVYKFTILEVSNTKIDLIKLQKVIED